LGRILESFAFSDSQLEDVRKLAEACNLYDSLDYLHPTKERALHGHHFQLYEGETLRGILTFPFNGRRGDPDPEAYVIVDPQHRRKGIGRSLVNAAKESIREAGTKEFLLVSEAKSASGTAFAKAVGGALSRSEIRMRLMDKPTRSVEETIHLRQAKVEDVDLLARVLARSFESPVEAHLDRLKRDIPSPIYRFYLAYLVDEPVGSIGVVAEDRRVYLVAFGVLAEYRGRGFGRQILTQTVNRLVSENWDEILIELDASNRVALSLYGSCGFRETTSYNYYAIKAGG
jgi:ribosomal protein S18 acetylase RimI-like enzyme